MKVERGKRYSLGSCNFCDRGEIRESGSRYPNANLEYPYTEVTTFCNEKGGGLKASICDDCLDELHAKVKLAQL